MTLSLLSEAAPDASVETNGCEWSPDPGFGAYVHIPFCRHRCDYCDFNTYEGADALHRPYVDALVRHIATWCERSPGLPRATSVFFGGGTPTLLPTTELARTLDTVRAGIGLGPDAEISIEVNPETVDERVFADLLDAGFNRVSIGVQSLIEPILVALGRTHSAERALAALAEARRAGFESVNTDLIYGSPWEDDDDWIRSLEGTLEVRPEHVSAYALTVEEGTPLATLVATGRAPNVDPDVQAARHAIADSMLEAAGYRRYEVSNWALPGHECRHNILYWCAGNYAGFGAGAHGHIDGRRYWAVRRPADFIARATSGTSTEAGSEVLDGPQRAGESLMLGLRLTGGIEESAWAAKYGGEELERRAPAIEELIAEGLLERSHGRLRTTPQRAFVGDEISRRLL